MKLQYTFSRAITRFLETYPDVTVLDKTLLLEVHQNGGWKLLDGRTRAHSLGQGIILTLGSESDMREQLRSALSFYTSVGWPHEQNYVERKVGLRTYHRYLTGSDERNLL
jgi:hypothetical protein